MRYCGAFRLLWALVELRGFDVVKTSISDVARLLLGLHHVSPSQARNAYSACLLFPQLQGLKFSILLKTVKRSWYKSEPRYATFYHATAVFCKFAAQPLDRTNVESVRLRLILVWRFLGSYRGVDLSRVYRVVSVVNGQGMVAVRRKGQKNVKFERVLSLTDESVSPWHLLNLYVSLTAAHARPGTPLLRALKPPYSPLSADRVNSITKGALTQLGVPAEYGAHSTRGAGVNLWVSLGLKPDMIARIGQWASSEAFSKFYLRLKALPHAESSILHMLSRMHQHHTNVHRASLGSSPSSESSASPPTQDRGREEGEDEAQDASDPPTPPVASHAGVAPAPVYAWSGVSTRTRSRSSARSSRGASSRPSILGKRPREEPFLRVSESRYGRTRTSFTQGALSSFVEWLFNRQLPFTSKHNENCFLV